MSSIICNSYHKQLYPVREINYITSVVFNKQERVNIYSYLVQQEVFDFEIQYR